MILSRINCAIRLQTDKYTFWQLSQFYLNNFIRKQLTDLIWKSGRRSTNSNNESFVVRQPMSETTDIADFIYKILDGTSRAKLAASKA